MAMTANALVSAVARRCYWPSSNAPLSDSDILAIADEELAGDAWPLVLASHGDYYVVAKDYAVVANQRFYRLPDRAYGGVVDVMWGDTNATDDEFVSLGTIQREDLGRFTQVNPATDVGGCSHFLEGDRLGLWPIPATARGTLRVKFVLRPGALVVTTSSNVAPITSFSYSGTTGTVGWTSGQLNPDSVSCDIVSSGDAHAHLVFDATMAVAPGDTNTFTYGFNPGVAVGDYLCRAGYTPLVQLPSFMHPYFIRRVAGACLAAAGDRPGAALELQEASRAFEKAQSTIQPRNQAEPNTIITRNSPMRVRGGYAWRR